jgi:hypothetical protein
MQISARLALLVLLLVAPAPLTSADMDNGAPFLVAVLRRDGTVIPFATFDGKEWKRPWPEDVRYMDVPIDLANVPRGWWGKSGPVAQLTAWLNGVNRGPVRLARPAMLRLMCAMRIGVRSDYQSAEPAPPPAVQPYPKDGLAVSGDQRVDPIEIVPPRAPEWTAAASAIAAEFDDAEERAVRAILAWKHPIKRAERRNVPVELEAMYRAPMDDAGWTAYYVEAVKHYPPEPEDRGCGLMTSVGGWMAVDPAGKRSIKLNARVTYCDRQGVTYMLPLGLIRANGRNYWAFQRSGYGREGYVISRPRPKETVSEVLYTAGNCPSF